MYKQAILVRQDLKMPKGKMCIQVAHASSDAVLKSDKKIIEEWKNSGAKKVVLKAADKRELIFFKKLAEKNNIKTALIEDAGKTYFKEPTITCLAIGPDKEEKIDKLTKELKLV